MTLGKHSKMKQVDPKEIDINAIKLISKDWMLVTAGDIEKYNTMTANWGAMGELWFKPVAFVFVRPQRYTYEFMEQNSNFTLSFFSEEYRDVLQLCGTKSGREVDKMALPKLTSYTTANGSVAFKEASIVLECSKMYVDTIRKEQFIDPATISRCYKDMDFHRMYVAEITSAWIK